MPRVVTGAATKRTVLGNCGNVMKIDEKEPKENSQNQELDADMKDMNAENGDDRPLSVFNMAAIRKCYTNDFLKALLDIAHQSQEDDFDSLVDDVCDEIKNSVFEKDVVKMKRKDDHETYKVSAKTKRGGAVFLKLRAANGTELTNINREEVTLVKHRTRDECRRLVEALVEWDDGLRMWVTTDPKLVQELKVAEKFHAMFMKHKKLAADKRRSSAATTNSVNGKESDSDSSDDDSDDGDDKKNGKADDKDEKQKKSSPNKLAAKDSGDDSSSEDDKPLAVLRRSQGTAPSRRLSSGVPPTGKPKPAKPAKKTDKSDTKTAKQLEREKKKEEKEQAKAEKQAEKDAKLKEKQDQKLAKEMEKEEKRLSKENKKGALTKFLVSGAGKTGEPLSPFMSPAKRAEKKFEVMMAKLRKEFNTGTRESFGSQVALAAKMIKSEQIDKVTDELIQYSLRRAFNKEQERESLKGKSTEEKAAYREKKEKEKDPEERKKDLRVAAALKQHFEEVSQREDLFVCASELPLGGEPVAGGHLFSDALMLTQAMQSLAKFLDQTVAIGAESLLDSMSRGWGGYTNGLGRILLTLVALLQQDAQFKVRHCGERLRLFTMDMQAVSEMCRAILIGETETEKQKEERQKAIASMTTTDETTTGTGAVKEGGKGDGDDAPNEDEQEEHKDEEDDDLLERSLWEKSYCATLLERFSADTELWELSPDDQMSVAIYVLQLVLDTQLYADYLQGGVTEKEHEHKAKIEKEQEKLSALEADLAEIPEIPDDVDETSMSRIESRMLEKNRQRRNELERKMMLCREIIEKNDEAIEMEKSCRKNAFRMQPLGMDRHFRRYWFFGKYAVNTGLWIQDFGLTREECLLKEAEKAQNNEVIPMETEEDEHEEVAQKEKSDAEAMPSFQKEQWACIRQVSDVEQFMKSLNEVGTREKLLKQALASLKDQLAEQKPLRSTERSASPANEFATPFDALKDTVRTFVNELTEKRLCLMKDAEERIVSADDMQTLIGLIVELVESIPAAAIKERLLAVFGSSVFTHERWVTMVRSAESCSHLFMLLDMVQCRIDWGASVNNKRCKKCGRKNTSDKKVVCKECETCYHIFCLRPKLQEVPTDSWLCANCDEPEEVLPTRNTRTNGKKQANYREDDVADEESDDDYDDFFAGGKKRPTRKRPVVEDSDFEDNVVEGGPRKSKRGKAEDPVKEECGRIMARIKAARIYQSFSNVPATRQSRSHRTEAPSFKEIEERLESGAFRSVDDFKNKVRSFLERARGYFAEKQLERKLEQIDEVEAFLDDAEDDE